MSRFSGRAWLGGHKWHGGARVRLNHGTGRGVGAPLWVDWVYVWGTVYGVRVECLGVLEMCIVSFYGHMANFGESFGILEVYGLWIVFFTFCELCFRIYL